MTKRHKYNIDTSKKGKQNRTYKSVVYDSKTEMEYFIQVIEPLMKSGEIKHCERQVRFELQPTFKHEGKTIRRVDYNSDFVVTFKDGRKEIIEIKGLADQTSKLKRKMFHYKFPEETLKWISYSKMDGGWVDYDELVRLRRERKKARVAENKIPDKKKATTKKKATKKKKSVKNK